MIVTTQMSAREDAKHERRKQARQQFFSSLQEFGGVLNAKEVAEMLKITETAVVGHVNSDRLIGLASSEHQEYLIPAFQFLDSRKLPYLEELLRALGEVSDDGACTWFLNEPFENFGRPADVLRGLPTDEQINTLLNDAFSYGAGLPT